MKKKEKLYSNTILWEAFTIPRVYKGNCYVFSLGPRVGKTGYSKHRLYKARPGDKCAKWKKDSFDFKSCTKFVKRVLCDNPNHVQIKYFNRLNTTNLKKYTGKRYGTDLEYGWHFIAAYLADGTDGEDFHFLRRVSFKEVNSKWIKFIKNSPAKTIKQFEIMKKSKSPPKYLWVHQRGWSPGGPIIHDAKNNIILHPAEANLKYPGMHYNKLCGIFKIKTRYASVTK